MTRGKNGDFFCPNKGHLNLVEDQVFKIEKLLLSVHLTLDFLCKANNNKYEFTSTLGYMLQIPPLLKTHTPPALKSQIKCLQKKTSA